MRNFRVCSKFLYISFFKRKQGKLIQLQTKGDDVQLITPLRYQSSEICFRVVLSCKLSEIISEINEAKILSHTLRFLLSENSQMQEYKKR